MKSKYNSKVSETGEYKSCPNCSRREGKDVFYSLHSFSNHKENTFGVQSWCNDCRRYSKSIPPCNKCSSLRRNGDSCARYHDKRWAEYTYKEGMLFGID